MRKLGICLKDIDRIETLSIYKKSAKDLWEFIKKPTSYDPKIYMIIETTKDSRERNLTELQNNIYILFDYQIHQYWCNNYFQPEFARNPCSKKMFGKDSNMCLIVNAHDDWQIRYSDKHKRCFNQFLKDNTNLSKRGYNRFRNNYVGNFR